jgi:hypothetical protein
MASAFSGRVAILTNIKKNRTFMTLGKDITKLKQMRRQSACAFKGQIIKVRTRTATDVALIKRYGLHGFAHFENLDFYPWFWEQLFALKTLCDQRSDLTIAQKCYNWFNDFMRSKGNVGSMMNATSWYAFMDRWEEAFMTRPEDDQSFMNFMYSRFLASLAGTLAEESAPVLPARSSVFLFDSIINSFEPNDYYQNNNSINSARAAGTIYNYNVDIANVDVAWS